MSQIIVPKSKRAALNVGDPLAEVIGGNRQAPFGLHPAGRSPWSDNGDNEGPEIESLPKAQFRRKGPP